MSVPEDPDQTEQRNLARTQSIARFHRMQSKRGEARRWRLEIIQGAAGNVKFYPRDNKVTLDVDGRHVELTASCGDPIALSEGDDVLIAARLGDPCRGLAYFNETTGLGSIDSMNRQARRMLASGVAGVLIAATIGLTAVLTARGDSPLSGTGMAHAAFYFLSIVISWAIFVFSCSLFAMGAHARKVCALLGFVANGQ
jgi:hypothetical protein